MFNEKSAGHLLTHRGIILTAYNPVRLPSAYIQCVLDVVYEGTPEAGVWLNGFKFIEAMKDHEFVELAWSTFNSFLLGAARFGRDEYLGLHIGERLLINAHGELGYAAMSAGSTRQLVELLLLFIPLRIDLVAIDVIDTQPYLVIRFRNRRPLGELEKILLEAIMLAIRNIIDFLTMGICMIDKVTFTVSGNATLSAAFFGCEVQYEQLENAIYLPQSFVDRPLKLANAKVFAHSKAVCEQELTKLQLDSYASRVRALLYKHPRGAMSLEMVAMRLHMTSRTLHRRLLSEGTSFRALQEEVRSVLAKQYLMSGTMNITEIAYTLGYSEISNLRKACKRWFGVAPSKLIQER